jgi:hypothetical protein
MSNVKTLNIRVVKAKTTIEVNVEEIDDATYTQIFALGVETYINNLGTKIVAKNFANDEELAKAALEAAQAKIAELRAGLMKVKGVKASKGTPAAVMVEARRRAKNHLKLEYKQGGGKPSQVEAKAWTQAANLYLETDDGKALIADVKQIMEQAKTGPITVPASILAGIKPSAKLVEAAEAKKAKAKAGQPISAAEAGKIVPVKGKAPPSKVAPAKAQPQHAPH